jgi:hypothetical protein
MVRELLLRERLDSSPSSIITILSDLLLSCLDEPAPVATATIELDFGSGLGSDRVTEIPLHELRPCHLFRVVKGVTLCEDLRVGDSR